MNIRETIQLLKLARKRLKSEADYRKFQEFQAKLLLDYLAYHRIVLEDKKLLDLGSGIAGYAATFAKYGAEVYCLDLTIPNTADLAELKQVCGDGQWIPVKDRYFDFVFCASLIEHVADPVRLLRELSRVLKPGCFAYVSFPPYFSPKGGHEFSPYHYLGEKLAIRLTPRNKKVPQWVDDLYGSRQDVDTFSDLYQGWGLFRMTISKFLSSIKSTNLSLVNMSTRYLPVSFIRWPIIGEFLTWHAQFLLRNDSQNNLS